MFFLDNVELDSSCCESRRIAPRTRHRPSNTLSSSQVRKHQNKVRPTSRLNTITKTKSRARGAASTFRSGAARPKAKWDRRLDVQGMSEDLQRAGSGCRLAFPFVGRGGLNTPSSLLSPISVALALAYNCCAIAYLSKVTGRCLLT